MNILPLNVNEPLVGTPVEVVGEFEEHRTTRWRIKYFVVNKMLLCSCEGGCGILKWCITLMSTCGQVWVE